MIRTSSRFTPAVLAICLAAFPFGIAAHAQDKTDKPDAEKPAAPAHYSGKSYKEYEAELHTTDCSKMPNRTALSDCAMAHYQTRIIRLNNAATQNEANEIQIATRNMFDPSIKIYLVVSQNAIEVGSYPEEIARIETFVRELDRPHKSYRVTFTMAESDGGKRVGVQHFSMIAIDGQRVTLKQGSKIPVITGTFTPGGTNVEQQQFQYLDIGMNFDLTLNQEANGVRLTSKVEQSSVADEKAGTGALAQEPIVRQTVLQGTSLLSSGKPVALGTIDVAGTTRHIDVEVMMEPIS